MKIIKKSLIVNFLVFCCVFAQAQTVKLSPQQLADTFNIVSKELADLKFHTDTLSHSFLQTIAQKDSIIAQKDTTNAEVDSLRDIVVKATAFRATAKVKFDSLKNENARLLQQLENEKTERMKYKWQASKIVFLRREKEAEEYDKNIVLNKMFYLGAWFGGGTGFADYDGEFSRRPNGGFSASWQLGKIFGLRSGVDWIRSSYIHKVKGYQNEDKYVRDVSRELQIPVLFELAIRKEMISAQIYGGAYFKGNLDGVEDKAVPGATVGVDIGVKAWQGYGFVGFQTGGGIVEYDHFNTVKIGYSFGLVTKKSYKKGVKNEK